MALTPVTPPIPRSLPSTFIPLRLPRASVEWVEQLAPTIAIPQHKVWTFGEIKTCWLKICPTSNPLIFARGCCILTLTLRDGAIKDWRRSSRVERGTYHPLKLPSVKTSNDMSSSSSRWAASQSICQRNGSSSGVMGRIEYDIAWDEENWQGYILGFLDSESIWVKEEDEYKTHSIDTIQDFKRRHFPTTLFYWLCKYLHFLINRFCLFFLHKYIRLNLLYFR